MTTSTTSYTMIVIAATSTNYATPVHLVTVDEPFLHIINPWILLTATLLLAISLIILHSLLALAFLITGIILLSIKHYRVWIMQQIYLIIATLRNVITKEIVWSKQAK